MHQNKPNHLQHEPVLLKEVLECLQPQSGESYLDLTAGYGGHAQAVLECTKAPEKAVLVDRDPNAIKALEKCFADQPVKLMQTDFYSASQTLGQSSEQFDVILADLGVSSPHLNESSRGFSIQMEGPLDMRMDPRQALTAEEIVNDYSLENLVAILKQYGEEPKSRQIAEWIVKNRPLHTTTELAAGVSTVWRGYSKVHPATRTFQALRIAVNNELELLRQSLPLWIEELLAPQGRLAIISFHSLEDRLVKQAFSEVGGDRYDAILSVITKHPLTASTQEIAFNPRARSAKLRAAVKQK